MKRHIIILLITFLCLPEYLEAQLKYYDAAKFPLYGKATKNTENRYERLPDSLKHVSRKPVWNLSRNSAGLAIRFCSNSTTIAAKWENLNNNLMNHMTPTGTKGLDLYTWVDGAWRFVNSGRPTGKVNQATIIANMEPVEREYMLYLPLYDGVVSLSIGIDEHRFVNVNVSGQDISETHKNFPISAVRFYNPGGLNQINALQHGIKPPAQVLLQLLPQQPLRQQPLQQLF